MKLKEMKDQRDRQIRAMGKMFLLTIFLLATVSCAPTLYSVDLKYDPQDVRLRDKDMAKMPAVVAAFRDARGKDNPLVLGKVIKRDGSEVPILPKVLKAPDAVAKAIQDHLSAQGFNVSKAVPQWDLREETISKDWRGLLIGGTIEVLDITCKEAIYWEYDARIVLALHFADAKKARIIHRKMIESRVSQRRFFLKESLLEGFINEALSEAVKKAFQDSDLRRLIREIKP